MPRRHFYIEAFDQFSAIVWLISAVNWICGFWFYLLCVRNINDVLFTVLHCAQYRCGCVCETGKRAIVYNLHDCLLNNINVVFREWEREKERRMKSKRESSSVEGFDTAVSGKFMLAIVLVSVAPYAHNFQILNHTSKSSNNWQYHVCTTLLGYNRKNQTIWTVRLVSVLNENWNIELSDSKWLNWMF